MSNEQYSPTLVLRERIGGVMSALPPAFHGMHRETRFFTHPWTVIQITALSTVVCSDGCW